MLAVEVDRCDSLLCGCILLHQSLASGTAPREFVQWYLPLAAHLALIREGHPTRGHACVLQGVHPVSCHDCAAVVVGRVGSFPVLELLLRDQPLRDRLNTRSI